MKRFLIKLIDSPHYGFAIRMTCAIALAWWLSCRFDLDRPAWSIMTVSILAYPNQGAIVAKFLARVIGTFLGAIVVNVLANISLSDPWLFCTYLTAWISLCAYMASCHRNMVTYCFALSGYTTAIIGFSLSSAPAPWTIFYVSQARISEIGLGLVCVALISFIFPSRREKQIAESSFKETGRTLIDLLSEILKPNSTAESIQNIYQLSQSKLMSWKSATLYDFLSPATRGSEYDRYTRYYDQMIRIGYACLNLQAMKNELLRNNAMASKLNKYLVELGSWYDGITQNNDTVAIHSATKPKMKSALLEVSEIKYFHDKIQTTLDELLEVREILNAGKSCIQNSKSSLLSFPSAPFQDKTEAFFNALRAFFCVIACVAFWFSGNWSHGHLLVILASIAFTLGATYPNLDKMILLVYILALSVIPFCYVLVYGILVSVTSIVPAMLIMLPIFFVSFLLKPLSKVSFIFSHVFIISLIFLINFDNPPTFDYGEFVNISMAIFVSVTVVTLAFNILRPSSDARRITRYEKMIASRFQSWKVRLRAEKKRKFEIYVDNAIGVASSSLDHWPNKVFQEYCRVCLLMADIAVKNGMKEELISDPFDSKFYSNLLKNNIDACVKQVEGTLRSSSTDDGSLFELSCVLQSLESTRVSQKN